MSKRRPLRPSLRPRHRRQTTHPHQQPGPQRLVSTIPEPRRRRITTRPPHQHQPPNPHGRTVLPAPETTRCHDRLTAIANTATLTTAAPNLRNYVTATPGELRDRGHRPCHRDTEVISARSGNLTGASWINTSCNDVCERPCGRTAQRNAATDQPHVHRDRRSGGQCRLRTAQSAMRDGTE
jgi:hypothetical protein